MMCRLTVILCLPLLSVIERKHFQKACLQNNLMNQQVNLTQRSTCISLVSFFRPQQHHWSDRVHLSSTERHLPQEG